MFIFFKATPWVLKLSDKPIHPAFFNWSEYVADLFSFSSVFINEPEGSEEVKLIENRNIMRFSLVNSKYEALESDLYN